MQQQSTNPFDNDTTSASNSEHMSEQHSELSQYEKIANFLIHENFTLTALEFHMELLELGHEVSVLKEFFSNPENFEKSKYLDTQAFTNKLTRTSSIQTFDSLDFSRYSDDGERCENDKIAVLEFELRKAHEQINSLRSALTKSSETAKKIQGDKDNKRVTSEYVIFEKRAVNFLINEYLLKQGYKLTAVTFSEENDNQDFEDWDDVGLNISKPTDLMSIFQDYDQNQIKIVEKKNVECYVNFQKIPSDDDDNLFLNKKVSELEQKILEISNENEELMKKINNFNSMKNKSEEITSNVENEEKNAPKSYENIQNTNPCPEEIIKKDSYQNYLIELVTKKDFEQDFHYSGSENSPKNFEKLIISLGITLPKIVPNISIAKRDQLLPLLIFTVMHHQSSKTRDHLLNLIFNLIKKPDDEQRKVILKGILTYSKNIGSLQVESELLPQCWEQITHKFLERRLLVAEACGLISPYVHNDTRVSLLLSMIKQLADDKEEDLREATVKSFSILLSFINNHEKYSQMTEMIDTFMHDSSERVLDACINILLPSFSRWCLRFECLQKFIIDYLISSLEKSTCKTVSNKSVSLIIKDAEVFKYSISSLKIILPYIFASIIKSAPKVEICENVTIMENNDFEVQPSFQSKILNQTESETEEMIKNYFTIVNQEWFECWSELLWFSNTLIIRLIEFLSILEIPPPLIKLVIKYFQNISNIFGANYIATQVKFRFEKYLSVPSDQMHSSSPFSTMSIIPVYVAGIHPCIILNHSESTKHKDSLKTFLCQLLSSLSVSCLPLISLQSAFLELCRYDDLEENTKPVFRDFLLKILWEFGVVHKNLLVRISTAKMFEWLISNCRYEEHHINNRILPALITLANDLDESVKISTISTFGSLIEYLSNFLNMESSSKIIDKIQFQMKTFMGDQTSTLSNNKIILELVRVLGKIGPRIDANLRDEFVLPKLTTLAMRNQISQNVDPNFKLDITLKLLDAFISALCCYVDDKISRDIILPGLRFLLHDIQHVAPNRADVVNSMIKELEEKTDPKMQHNEKVQTPNVSNSETSKYTIINKFKDVKNLANHKNFSKIFYNSDKQ